MIIHAPVKVIIKYFKFILPFFCSNNTNLAVNHMENPNIMIPIGDKYPNWIKK